MQRKTQVKKSEFDSLFQKIDNFRTDSEIEQTNPLFTKVLETLAIIENIKRTDILQGDRFRFLSWPKARSYYDRPEEYHRVITTLLLRRMAVEESSRRYLNDIRDNSFTLVKRGRQSISEGTAISKITEDGMVWIRNEFVNFMDAKMNTKDGKTGRSNLPSFSNPSGDLSEIVEMARSEKNREKITLDQLGEEFRQYDIVAGWDELPQDHPIRIVVASIKPNN